MQLINAHIALKYLYLKWGDKESGACTFQYMWKSCLLLFYGQAETKGVVFSLYVYQFDICTQLQLGAFSNIHDVWAQDNRDFKISEVNEQGQQLKVRYRQI